MIGVRVSSAREARHYLTAAPPADDEPLAEVIPEREPLVAVRAKATVVDWDPHQGEMGLMIVLNIGDVGQLSATIAQRRIDAGDAVRA